MSQSHATFSGRIFAGSAVMIMIALFITKSVVKSTSNEWTICGQVVSVDSAPAPSMHMPSQLWRIGARLSDGSNVVGLRLHTDSIRTGSTYNFEMMRLSGDTVIHKITPVAKNCD